MSLTARAYIAAVVLLGAVALVNGLWGWTPQHVLSFACYFALAVPASCLKVRLPGVTGTMSVLFVIILAVIAELGLPEAMIIGVCCTLVQCVWQAKRTTPPRPTAVYRGEHRGRGMADQCHVPVSLACGAFPVSTLPVVHRDGVFFVANTLPVAGVIALTENKPLGQVWNTCYLWTFSYYMAGAAIVGVFAPVEPHLQLAGVPGYPAPGVRNVPLL